MKTIQYTIAFFLIAFVSSVQAQFFNIINQRLYGTIDATEVRNIDTINANIVIGFFGGSVNVNNYKTCAIGSSDAWVSLFDNNLNEIWQNCYGGLQSDLLFDVIVNHSANEILIAATSQSGISGNKTTSNLGNSDFWLIKTDANGAILNQYAYGGSGDDTFFKILLLDDGYLLCGSSDSPVSGNKTTANRGFSDYWVIKTDFNGNKVWEKVYGGTGYDGITGAISIQGTDKIILYGTSDSPIGFEKTKTSFGYNDYWLLMIDTTGNVIWDQQIGTSDSEYGGGVTAVYFQQVVYLISGTNGPVSGTLTNNVNGISDIWITKLDLNGNILWDKCIGGDVADYCTSAIVHNNQLWLGANSSSGISGHKTENSRGGIDYWLLAIDSSANILFQKTIGGSNWDSMHKLFFTSPNSVLMAGFSNSPVSGDKTIPPFGTEDLWFVQAELSVGVEENSVSNAYKVYPNPANEKVYIQNEKNEIRKIELFDVTGRLILETNNLINSALTELNLSLIKNGYYVLRLTDSKRITTSHKLIKQ